MLPAARIPIWTLWRRRRFLEDFVGDARSYFSALTFEAFPYRVVEGDEARRIREELTPRLPRCRRTVSALGTVPLRRLAPGDQEGTVREVNLVTHLFELDRYSISHSEALQTLDAAVSGYRKGTGAAWRRTLNPLYWLDMGLSALEVVPFLPLRLVGVPPGKAARSGPGTLVRTVVRLAGLVLLGWVGLQLLGGSEELRGLFRTDGR